MYGLTDNIVAGPAGQVTAAAAGSFMAGPPGSFTPAPAGHTPVYPVTTSPPPSGAGYVPIDTFPARVPYAAPSGGAMHLLGGSTMAPIPGPQASVPVSPATAGGTGFGGGGGLVSGGGGFGGGGGGGGVSAASSGGAISAASGTVGGGGGGGGAVSAGSNPGAVGGGGGGGVAAGTNMGVMPSAGSNPGAVGGPGGGTHSTVAYAGVGFPPMELRVGQAFTPATAGGPPTAGTQGFTVTPGGRTIPSPVGYVHPPPASRFHAPQHSRTSRHPVHVQHHTTHSEAYEPYKPSYVWPGREPADPPPPFLASDYLKPSAYEPPRLLFEDERVGMATVDASVGARGSMTVNENVAHTLHQDFSQTRNVEFSNNTYNDRNLVLDNSISRTVVQNNPEYREVMVNIVQTQGTVLADPRVDLTLAPPVLGGVVLGGPVLARVA